MARQHAQLSPSSAHRWMLCPGSVRLEAGLPDTGQTSEYAAEGSAAHTLAEKCLRRQCDAQAFLGETLSADGFTFPVDDVMAGHVQTYLDFVRDLPGTLLVEQQVCFDAWVPEGFGTADAIVLHDGTMYVIDLKYGQGVKVEAEENPQALCYALGALNDYGFLFEVTDIRMVIVQPRLDHISAWSMTAEALIAWAEKTLRPAAALALTEDAPVTPGPKQCQFCDAKGVCAPLAERNARLAAEAFEALEAPLTLRGTDTLTPDEVAWLLPQLDLLTSWAGAVKAQAISEMERGRDIPGHKLVAGRSLRKWADEAAAEAAFRKTKLKVADIFVKKLISPKKAEERLGKTHKILTELVVKPQGRPTIAPLSDRRPALIVDPAAGFPEAA